jgi:hypothetical protein
VTEGNRLRTKSPGEYPDLRELGGENYIIRSFTKTSFTKYYYGNEIMEEKIKMRGLQRFSHKTLMKKAV